MIRKAKIQNPTIGQYNPLAESFIFHPIPYIVLFGSISWASDTTYGMGNGNDWKFWNF